MRYHNYFIACLVLLTAANLAFAAFSTPTISPANPTVDHGQSNSITFTSTWSGGTAPYTANLVTPSSSTCSTPALNQSLTGLSTGSATFSPVATQNIIGGSTISFCVIVTDSEASPATENSVLSTVTINSALTPILITEPTSGGIDIGQPITYYANAEGGTSPYTYKYQVFNSVTGTILASATYSTASSTNTFTWTPSSAYIGNTVEANVVITDSATAPITNNSINTAVISINAQMLLPQLSSSSNPVIAGQQSTLTATWSGGTAPFTAKLYSSATSTCNSGSTLVQTQSSLSSGKASFTASPASATFYCVNVTDSAYPFNSPAKITKGINSLDQGAITIAPSGTYAYIGNSCACLGASNGNVVILDTATNTVTGKVTGGFSEPLGIAFSPDGSYAYAANSINGVNDNLLIVNTATNSVIGTISGGMRQPEGIAFAPSGIYAYLANYAASNILIINTATNTVKGSISSGIDYPAAVAFSPDGTFAYAANLYSSTVGNIAIINTATNTVAGFITNGIRSPIGIGQYQSYYYVINNGNFASNVVIINSATNTVIRSFTFGFDSPEYIAIANSGQYAYLGTGTGIAIVNLMPPAANSTSYELNVTQAHGAPTGGGPAQSSVATTIATTNPTTIATTVATTVAPLITLHFNSSNSIFSGNLTNNVSILILTNNTTGYVYYRPVSGGVILQPLPNNLALLYAANLTVTGPVKSVSLTTRYNCTYPEGSLAPYGYSNGAWKRISSYSINASSCTATFAAKGYKQVALLSNYSSPTTAPATKPQEQAVTAPAVSAVLYYIIGALIIIAIIVVAISFYRKRY